MADEPHSSLLPVEWAVVSRPLPGQTAMGDGSLVKPTPEGVLLAVVDGLGHGAEAAKAADASLGAIAAHSGSSLISIVHLCNEALKETRGVVMSIAFIDLFAEKLTWLSIGNVDAVLLRSNPQNVPSSHNILQRGGVLGFQIPTLQTDIFPLGSGDLLIFSTDGIRAGFASSVVPTASCAQIAQSILAKFFKGSDDALVLVARYRGRRP
jgi:serine phosphatase RsbU (regulator of sigma subunit)